MQKDNAFSKVLNKLQVFPFRSTCTVHANTIYTNSDYTVVRSGVVVVERLER